MQQHAMECKEALVDIPEAWGNDDELARCITSYNVCMDHVRHMSYTIDAIQHTCKHTTRHTSIAYDTIDCRKRYK